MNASSLYVTVLRLVVQNDSENVFRLFPYLRQSLSCTVCGNLLSEPYSPLNSPCQHHECKGCIGGRKILKPSCTWCRDRGDSVQNVQLRLLLQCYKSLCEYIKLTPIYEGMKCQVQINTSQNSSSGGGGASGTAQNNSAGSHGGSGSCNNGVTNRLADIIDEGIRFNDEFKSTAGLPKATYSMLPCLYQTIPVAPPAAAPPPQPPLPPAVGATSSIILQHAAVKNQNHQMPANNQRNPIHSSSKQMPSSSPLLTAATTTIGSAMQQQQAGGAMVATRAPSHHSSNSTSASSHNTSTIPPLPIIKTVSNGSALYSVMYAGSGNKITIKRKTEGSSSSQQQQQSLHQNQMNELGADLAAAGGDSVQKAFGGQMIHTSSSTSSAAVAQGMPVYSSSSSSSANQSSQDFKKPPMSMKSKALAKRKGCRCGNATLTPGKLTCCGQRCPCYVESKSCIDCKCRGCRNPHRPNGFKVRPHIPELENLDFHLNAVEQQRPIMKTVLSTLNSGGGLPAAAAAGNGLDLGNGTTYIDGEYTFMAGSERGGGSSVLLDNNAERMSGPREISDLEAEINLHGFHTANIITTAAGNVPQGKIQLLNVYTSPQVNSALPTIIMSGGMANSGNNFGTSQATATSIQLPQNQSYTFSNANSNSFVTGNGTLLTTTATGRSTSATPTFNVAGGDHHGFVPSNVTFHSLFGEELLGASSSAAMVQRTITALDDEDLEAATGGVIIGSYESDQEDPDELSPGTMQLNDAVLDDESDCEEDEDEGPSEDLDV